MGFSIERADSACNFFQKILKHTADDWWGKDFELSPWQEEAVREIFGTIDEDDHPVIEMAYLEVPKKAGKTEFAAGIVLMALLLDPNPGCQVYGAAASQKQAGNVYRAACKMVEQNPLLRESLRILRGTNRIIKRRDPESFYAAIAADGDLSDGVNPSVVVADEVHRWRERKHLENWDVLSLGGITRRKTLTLAITTAGVRNESPLAWRLHEKTERINKKVATDKTFFGRIYAADRADDWTKEETWIKANPSLKQNGGFLDIKKIREKYEASLSDFESQRSFRRYYLNLWDEKENRCVDLPQWDALPQPWKAQGLLSKNPEDLVRPIARDLFARFMDRTCTLGVDMSFTNDMSAVTFIFPDEDGFFDVLPFFWMPEEGLKKRELRDGMPYRSWAEQGYLELSTGAAIDFRDIRARIDWGLRNFDVRYLCFDKHESRQISIPLTEEGHPCVEIPQAFGKSEANKKFLELIAAKKLRHGGHPILRFNASCLSSEERDGRIKFVKPERMKDSSRIDGIDAATDALFYGMIPELQPAGRLMEII